MMLALMIFILQATVAPKGSIEGIVIRSGTEIPQPLPNARVYLESAPGTGATVRTNSGGRFVLNDVAPGRYRFVVEKGGYARHNAQITMSPGQEMKDMVVPLTPAGTISGWVRTEKGEPIANAIVFASRLSYGARGEQMMTRQYHTRTNDLGEYRLFWLTPDEYFISATYTKDLMGPLFTAINPNEAPEPEGYVPIYYPGTAVAADAAAIKLEPGTEVEGIGFVMRRLPTLAVSGKTTNAVTGRPIAARLGLIPERDGGVRGSYQEQAADDGSFQFRGVTPGAYTLAASTIGNTGLSAFSRIEVRDSDMRDVNLALGPGLSLSGQITGEPLGGGSPLTFNRTQVILVPIDSSAPASASGFTKPDGSFTLTSVQPGEYSARIPSLDQDLYVKSVMFGNAEVSGSGFRIGPAPPTDTLSILVSANSGRIEGTVLDRAGKPAVGAQVVLVPEMQKRHRTELFKLATSDQNGKFLLRGIAPGEYTVYAWEAMEPRAYLNAEFLSRHQDFGFPVRIQAGENNAIQIRLSPPAGSR